MSDYLTRLVERSLGSAPQLQPVIAPIHAPVAPWAGDEPAEMESESARVPTRAKATERLPEAATAHPDPAEEDVHLESSVALSTATPNEPHPTLFVPREDALPLGTRQRRAEPLAAPAVNRHPGTPPLEPRLERKNAVAVSPQRIERIERSAPLAAPTPEGEPARVQQTIRVTIGRVDVRAIIQPAPAPAAREARREPRYQSLEDYLRTGQNGAQR